ncbi:MAG: HDOD domain-containing protein [Chitinivibrionales bacterium]|nr:HDOD domain-containing protein [Chitinivibrionales bacterium]
MHSGQPTILYIIEQVKEAEILRLFFQHHAIHAFGIEPNYAGLLVVRQYKPICIIIEMKANYTDVIRFIDMVRSSKQGESVPLIAYGSHTDKREIEGITNLGITAYLRRPLRTKELMECITKGNTAAATPSSPSQASGLTTMDILMDGSVKPETKIETIVKSVESMKALPFTVAKVREMTRQARISAQELARVIAVDPGLSSTILKIANSVYFASNSRRFATIADAIVRIGLMETRNVVFSRSLIDSVSMESRSIGFDRTEFWYHCLATAIIAEKLLEKADYQCADAAFLAGLLHDFSVILLDEYFHDLLTRLLDATAASLRSFPFIEKKNLGIQVNDCVVELFKKWNLPRQIISVVKFINGFPIVAENQPEKPLIEAVGLAHCIAKTIGIGRECDCFIPPLHSIRFPTVLDGPFFSQIQTALDSYTTLLNINRKNKSQKPGSVRSNHTVGIITDQSLYFDFVERYCLTQGYQVVKKQPDERIDTCDCAVDLVIIHCGKSSSLQSFAAYLSLQSDASRQLKTGDGTEYVPVIILVNKPMCSEQIVSNALIAQIPYGFDLRTFNYVMESFLKHQVIQQFQLSLKSSRKSEPKIQAHSGQTAQEELSISTHRIGTDIVVVDFKGSVLTKDITILKRQMAEILGQNHSCIALNFASIDIVDSLLIGLVAGVYKEIMQKQSRLFFINLNEAVLESFETVGLTKIFTILKDEAALLQQCCL